MTERPGKEDLLEEVVERTEIPATGAVTWFDQGKPWAVFTVEDVVLNADVSQVIRED